MASTYLQLCNFALERLNEVNLTSSTFASAVGFQAAVKSFVNDALNDIYDAEPEWPFLKSASTLTLTANSTSVQTYALAADMSSVDWDSFFIQPSGTDISAQALKYIDFDAWRKIYKATDRQVMNDEEGWTKPVYVFQTQDDPSKVGFSPVPDEAYVVEYDYWIKPTALSDYTDTHVIPDRYEPVIKHGIMSYCYKFRDNEDQATKSEKKFDDGVRRMRRDLINRDKAMRSGVV